MSTVAKKSYGKEAADMFLANLATAPTNDKMFAKHPVAEGETFILARGVKITAKHSIGLVPTGGIVSGDGMAQIMDGSAKIQTTVPGTTAKRVAPASTLEPKMRSVAAINFFRSAPLAGAEECAEQMARFLDVAEDNGEIDAETDA